MEGSGVEILFQTPVIFGKAKGGAQLEIARPLISGLNPISSHAQLSNLSRVEFSKPQE